MKGTLSIMFIIAAALVVLVTAWIAAAQGSSSSNDNCVTGTCYQQNTVPTNCPTDKCGNAVPKLWYEN